MGVSSGGDVPVFASSAIEALYRRWNLEGAYLSGNEFWVCCPFHNEKRAAFSVNLVTGQWFCLGCKARGRSLPQLIAAMDGINVAKAEDVLEKYGFDTLSTLKQEVRCMLLAKIERPERDGVDTLRTDEWRRYQRHVAPYLLKRGFTEEVLRDHRIGYDKVTQRIHIPVFEASTCRFVYDRITWKKRDPKKPSYRYPHGVDKSYYLWGITRRPSYYEGKTVILTEGGLDALWLRQHGYKNAFAILGSFMSWGQVKKLEELNPGRIILAFDNDKAGLECTIQTGKMLLRAGFDSCFYLRYPKGVSDPQEANSSQLERMFARRRSVRPLALEIGKKKVGDDVVNVSRYRHLLSVS